MNHSIDRQEGLAARLHRRSCCSERTPMQAVELFPYQDSAVRIIATIWPPDYSFDPLDDELRSGIVAPGRSFSNQCYGRDNSWSLRRTFLMRSSVRCC
jgi:hypothetical protein